MGLNVEDHTQKHVNSKKKCFQLIHITEKKDYLNMKEICHVNQFTFRPIIEKKIILFVKN